LGTINSRNSDLLRNNFYQLLVANLGGKLCLVIMTLIDAVIGSRIIGADGMAAVAIFSPIIALDETLHALFGSGITILYTRLCGRNEKEKANRTYTAVLAATLLGYSLVCGLLILFSKHYVAFYADTPELYEMGLAYFLPMVVGLPFFEMGLITERVFYADGRVFFFSLRNIITIILNILLDLVFVIRFSMGVRGLALATLISTAVGYMLTLSHIFSKKNTVRLSFDVFHNLREFWNLIIEELRIGSGYVLNGLLDTALTLVINKFAVVLGGSIGLFALSMFFRFDSVILILSMGVAQSTTLIASTLYGEEDYAGTNIVMKTGYRSAALIGGVCTILSIALSGLFLQISNVTETSTIAVCLSAIRIGAISFPGIMFMQVFRDGMIISENYSLYRFCCITSVVLQVILIWILSGLGTDAIWISYAVIPYVSIIITLLAIRQRKKPLFPKECSNVIKSVSAILNEATVGELSVTASKILTDNGYSKSFSNRIGLLVEEAYSYILRMNDAKREIHTDLRLIAADETIHISICDDGTLCDPATGIQMVDTAGTQMADTTGTKMKDATEDSDIELLLLKGISDTYTYNRIANLNYTRIDCAAKAQQC